MAPEGMRQIERMAAQAPAAAALVSAPVPVAVTSPPKGLAAHRCGANCDAALTTLQPAHPGHVEDDVATLSMSTCRFRTMCASAC
jgi:hypothetical protein